MAEVLWRVKDSLKFNDLAVGKTFRIVTGRGAVYRKVTFSKRAIKSSLNNLKATLEGIGVKLESILNPSEQGYSLMEEIATGKLFPPTQSDVEEVAVKIMIESPKPALAGY